MKEYKGQLIFVVVCILLSAIASAVSSLFLQSLIDDYITPLLGSSSPVFSGLLKTLIVIGVIYLIECCLHCFTTGLWLRLHKVH